MAEDRIASIKKQVEYYFSDKNMAFDAFFQQHIRADPEGWMDMKVLLNSPKLKSMGVTQAEIFAALADSELETKKDGENGFVRRTTPLPELRPRGSAGSGKLPMNQDPSRAYLNGIVARICNVPEEANATAVKAALIEKLPKEEKKGKNNAPVTVMYVTRPGEDNKCYVIFRPFQGDMDAMPVEFEVNGAKLKAEPVLGEEWEAALAAVPKAIKDNYLKNSLKAQKAAKAANMLRLCGLSFPNGFKDLKLRMKQLVARVGDNTVIPTGGNDHNLLVCLLDFHPKGAAKKEGLEHFVVKDHAEFGSKCFFVKRAGSEELEDFSIAKCIAEMEANPAKVKEWEAAHYPAQGGDKKRKAEGAAAGAGGEEHQDKKTKPEGEEAQQ